MINAILSKHTQWYSNLFTRFSGPELELNEFSEELLRIFVSGFSPTMVTTRSQEKGLSTPVSASTIEVILPSVPRSTPKSADSPSVTRITRSTPRSSGSVSGRFNKMGAFASKAAARPNPPAETIETTASDETSEPAQQTVQDDTVPQTPSKLQESSITYPDLTHPDPILDQDDGESTTLPERLKFSPPANPVPPSNAHKRFHSEEPEEPASLRNEADTEPFQTTVDSFAAPLSSDESDGAPEVVTTVSRKSTNRVSKGRKRRRLEETVVETGKNTTTPVAIQVSLVDHSVTDDIASGTTQIHDVAGNEIPTSGQRITTVTNQTIPERTALGSGNLEPNTNTSIRPKVDELKSGLQDTIEPAIDADIHLTSADRVLAPPGNDAEADPGLVGPNFKVPLFTKHESKISGLNTVDIGNTTALDDAESGSHTEAGSATLTNNSYVTVPEDPSPSNGETITPKSAGARHQNPVENLSLRLSRQESSSKRMSGRQARPRMAMPELPPPTSSLQNYRQRVLDRNPRTSVWGPPGFRRTRFVGA